MSLLPRITIPQICQIGNILDARQQPRPIRVPIMDDIENIIQPPVISPRELAQQRRLEAGRPTTSLQRRGQRLRTHELHLARDQKASQRDSFTRR